MSTSDCYNVVVFGEPGVGKTCFIDQFCFGKSFVDYNPDDTEVSHPILVEGQAVNLAFMDLSTAFMKPEHRMHGEDSAQWARKMLANADGVVLLYDVTSSESFEYITTPACDYLWESRDYREGGIADERKNFGCVLVGNKIDLVNQTPMSRRVSQELANGWASTQGMNSIEVDSLAEDGPKSALRLLVKNIWKREKMGLMGPREVEKQETESRKESIRNRLLGVLT
ncbi:hypothetical protein E8E13_005037 [Curvularia kusanoi]|uniref:P-loop containing nucleoside triphosphate hydrolase protein n=1 Tax=Curvularia kusanoi TaxID=90978 RepID=A0A9P4T7B8_CURKU|nr:hypothetical protein E8E13_005037 [Curvularia kusanoi]